MIISFLTILPHVGHSLIIILWIFSSCYGILSFSEIVFHISLLKVIRDGINSLLSANMFYSAHLYKIYGPFFSDSIYCSSSRSVMSVVYKLQLNLSSLMRYFDAVYSPISSLVSLHTV